MNREEEIFRKHLAMTTPFPIAIEIEKAEGSWLYGPNGEKYLDFISGVSVSNLGHGHPAIKQAIHEQVEKHLHIMVYGEYVQSTPNRLAERLAGILPEKLNCSYFVNSGAESIEGALKLAKRYTERTELIGFRGSYHGSTHGALSLSGNETKKRAFRPLLPDVRFLNFNKMEELQQITERTAAVLVETIQGDAGVRIPDKAYMQALRTRCSEVGALLILDEIQTGIGRCGTWFAFEQFDIVPDILCTAKALGGGLPLGAFISDQKIMQCLSERPMLGHITTFGGNPVACAAADATLKVIEDERLLDSIEKKGALIESLLQNPRIKEVRRRGLFFAIDFESAEEVMQIVQGLQKKGLLSFWFLSCPHSFRIAPPLNISEEDIRWACELIQEEITRLD
ncbi:aspartate aminotransferase family protein [Croceimicrobium sp.]|uniref:aspartate aminotransferase family protein n=1 Tax=Croceimicrobium sp. TaxID=2828340 RepID=UPI003BABBF09